MNERTAARRGGERAEMVLLVEDDGDTRDLVTDALRSAGFAVLASDEGRKALELATEMRPRAVVLDLQMPGMDGLEFLRRRRGLPGLAATPVVVITGGDAPGVDPGTRVLRKPFRLEELVDAVRALVGGRAGHRSSA